MDLRSKLFETIKPSVLVDSQVSRPANKTVKHLPTVLCDINRAKSALNQSGKCARKNLAPTIRSASSGP